MAMRRGQVVLVDTNVIIEAFRAQCWNAVTLISQYRSFIKSSYRLADPSLRAPGCSPDLT